MRRLAAALLLLIAQTAAAGSQVSARHAAVATSNPAVTQIGVAVLQRGGNAIDAAVAMAFALSTIQPQSAGIGGGGILTYYDASSHAVWILDFLEAAPNEAKREAFAGTDPVTGPRAASTPAMVAGLHSAHERFGSKAWRDLIEPSITIASGGMTVSRDLANALAASKALLEPQGPAMAIFFADGAPLAAGAKLVQADLALTLDRIAANGAREFYEGDTAKLIVEGTRAAGGLLNYRDLAEYQPQWRAPLQLRVGGYEVYVPPPPSGGGMTVASMLQMLAGYDLAAQKPATLVHLEAEAARRALVDRSRYVGDPVSARIPYRELLSSDRGAQWRATIDLQRVTTTATIATPPVDLADTPHTTHLSVVDHSGNVVALTLSVGGDFGSGFVVPGTGFFLNSAINSFSRGGANDEQLQTASINAIDARKRAAVSACPTIVLHDGKPVFALGSVGGARIPTTIAQILVDTMFLGRSLPEAIAAPRFHQQPVPEELSYEPARTPAALLQDLAGIGHAVSAVPAEIGDVNAVAIYPDHLVAISDPRRSGAAGGY